MNDLIKKGFLEESEVLLKSEIVTLLGVDDFKKDKFETNKCQASCSSGCSISCSSGCSKQRAS